LLDRANAADRLTFRRAYRRKHPILATLAWFAESEWRIALLIFGALALGFTAEAVIR
jgi:hypothetical protein